MNQAERTEAIIVWVLISFFGGWVLSIFGIGIGPGMIATAMFFFVVLKLIDATAKSNSGEPPEFTNQR
ncbi:hypothetical protein KR52_10865 [Synechococcus sp. KORDI-52]|uniref:hypothetical protein n=1 Tax=Synechococcus sp. KORDI-52 TaxID=585425 RepID=UPI0004E07E97|nr:hypothetical protein [Synechococcus sp. KORDI-52]AII49640.1 hypothetical protein KR52_10865 [Synechococcus sp. KORDI-52]